MPTGTHLAIPSLASKGLSELQNRAILASFWPIDPWHRCRSIRPRCYALQSWDAANHHNVLDNRSLLVYTAHMSPLSAKHD